MLYILLNSAAAELFVTKLGWFAFHVYPAKLLRTPFESKNAKLPPPQVMGLIVRCTIPGVSLGDKTTGSPEFDAKIPTTHDPLPTNAARFGQLRGLFPATSSGPCPDAPGATCAPRYTQTKGGDMPVPEILLILLFVSTIADIR
jgi:hypothetical protein